ncbi:(3R)-3-[(carboxymethyl)amino]fatty acid oxygenase/decarboxylase [Nocardia arthritidis]|uniref:TauD/TfdA family dioxygenase n=1 Tax=Nocardia arthritidis TaxID=228602 RepID=A0A6G9YF15_9NOCA|nr:TauD/TfdA family dioxygenase [Nocardia arthritidis]QIS11720.1 TauD/TfdA family dioxygenase [Nocardia arthritidis]
MQRTAMRIAPRGDFGVVVEGFDPADGDDIRDLKRAIYRERIALVRGLDLDPHRLLALASAFGQPVRYYEPIYAHPEVPDVFVSSNVDSGPRRVGVPKTGKFWHSDYQFMPRPFDLTFIHPVAVPSRDRGTYFIDLARAHETIDARLRAAVAGTTATHSVHRYFKIRPADVYRPISEVLAEIQRRTPPVTMPTIHPHPHTGADVVYVSEGFTTMITEPDGTERPDLLHELLDATGQLDETMEHPAIRLQTFDAGDLLIWDNRSLIHRARHTSTDEPTVSHRVTVYDDAGIPA